PARNHQGVVYVLFLFIPGMADVMAEVAKGSDEVLEVDLLSGRLDLSGQLDQEDDGGSEDPSMPLRISFSLQDLKLTEKLGLTGARGQFNRKADGSLDGGLRGLLGGEVPLELSLTRPSEGGGSLTMSSSDAGAALEAADLYRGAKGGRLVVNAQFGRGEAGGVSGSARIDDITVRSASTFQRVLRQGGLEQAQAQITRSGLGFRKVWVPFEYRDGVLTLSDAIATSSALALKVNGTLDEETEVLDLSGVMSPAYALTGVLNEVPVLGQILSGGEGEGILAMTFTLRGPARDPELSVNPLSLLAPGFLRNLFSGGGSDGTGSEKFQARIRNAPDR
ncbi:MAG: AsmA-like C-terminal domain-containing protein, partial [Pseudomonadota bacterium]